MFLPAGTLEGICDGGETASACAAIPILSHGKTHLESVALLHRAAANDGMDDAEGLASIAVKDDSGERLSLEPHVGRRGDAAHQETTY